MDDNKEALMEEHKENVRRNRTMGSSFWKWTSLVLFILLILLACFLWTPFDKDKDAKAAQALDFINGQLLKGYATANLNDVTAEDDLYVMNITIRSTSGQTQDALLYMNEEGTLLFPSAISITETTNVTEQPEISEISTEGQPTIGPEDAKVTIIEFSDFQCPYCEKGYTTMEQILEKYPNDVKLVFINFPLSFHEYAQKAAEAGECANAQGKFEEYYNKLFENQDALTMDDLKQYASDLDLDTEVFNTCLDSGEMADTVKGDAALGEENGVTGTPAFFINGQMLVGARPIADFEIIIDAELAEETA
jgi:protein-disulfide isomerase